jgi:hypothetical protein
LDEIWMQSFPFGAWMYSLLLDFLLFSLAHVCASPVLPG